jgi:hypothetical protein
MLGTLGPWFLMSWGVLLTLKPNVFVRGIWKRTSIAQRFLSPNAYLIYTRSVGTFFIAAGFIWLLLLSVEPRIQRSDIAAVKVAGSSVEILLTPKGSRKLATCDRSRDARFGFPLSGCKDIYISDIATSGISGIVTVRCPSSDCASEVAASLTKREK